MDGGPFGHLFPDREVSSTLSVCSGRPFPPTVSLSRVSKHRSAQRLHAHRWLSLDARSDGSCTLWSPGARSKLAVIGSSLFSQHCKQAFCFGRDCHSAERDTPLSGLPSRSVEVSPHLIWSLLKFLFRSSPSVDQTLSQLLSLGSSSASWLWWNRTRPAGEQPSSLSFLHLCSP